MIKVGKGHKVGTLNIEIRNNLPDKVIKLVIETTYQ